MNVNVKKLKRELTTEQIIQIVKSLGGELYSQNDKELIFYSCCHHIDAHAHKPKLYYYIDTMSFFCYSCSSAFDIISLVETRWKLEGKDFGFVEVLKYIGSIAGIDLGSVERTTPISNVNTPWQEILGKYQTFDSKGTALKPLDKRILKFFPRIYPEQWYEQGIGLETMYQFGIGYYEFKNQTVIPCMDIDNNLIGIRVRNWNDTHAKYDVLRVLDDRQFKFSTSYVLYGLNFAKYAIEKCKSVILVESEKAVMQSVTWYGHKSIAVGMFGDNINKYRRNLLLNLGIDKVIIVPDYDYQEGNAQQYTKWLNKQLKLAKKFEGYCSVEIVLNDGRVPYKDNIFDVDRKAYEYLFERRVNVSEIA